MGRLVYAPFVRPLTVPKMDYDALCSWAYRSDLMDMAEDDRTPLGKLDLTVFGSEDTPEHLIEFAGRHCYRSWEKGRDHEEYVENILKEAHGSVLEHVAIPFVVTGISRSLSLELIRHRAGTAVSQESQRYVDAKDVRFVIPPLLLDLFSDDDEAFNAYKAEKEEVVKRYTDLQHKLEDYAQRYGWSKRELRKRVNEAARCVLPNDTETRMVWTMNARAMRHILELRGSEHADMEIRRLAVAFYYAAKRVMPVLLRDFNEVAFTCPSGIHSDLPGKLTCLYHKV